MKRTFLALFLFLFLVFGNTVVSSAQNKAAEIDQFVKAYTDRDMFNGSVLVAKRGEIILKKGYGTISFPNGAAITPDTKFCIASLNKQFTAVLIMQLREQGKLDLQTPISTYLPWYRKDIGDQITIHQLLSHTAGLSEYTERPDFFSTISKKEFTHRDFVEKYCSDTLISKPGTAYRYTNMGYYLLGTIIEAVTGQDYKEVLQKQILSVLGMKNTGMAKATDSGQAVKGYTYQLGTYSLADPINLYSTIFAAGGMYSTVGDLHLWDRALYTDKLLTEKSKEILFTPVMENYAYGFGVVKNFIFHQGAINGFRSIITRVTDEQEVIIVLSNNFDTDPNPISNGIYAILHHQPYKMPKQPISMAVGKKLRKDGISKAIAFFKAQQNSKDSLYNFEGAEGGLNTLGYYLAGKARLNDALAILELNTESFPKSANVFDSYAEMLANAGRWDEAILNYNKVLAIEPSNSNAKAQLQLLKTKVIKD